jgi:hypothetical protein
MSRVIPLSGTDESRIDAAAQDPVEPGAIGLIKPKEIHTIYDLHRVFFENRPVGPVFLGDVADEAAMTGLNISHERGCFPMDVCYRTDESKLYLCVTNRGVDAGDWRPFS